MSTAPRLNLWHRPRLGGLLTATTAVAIATACWLLLRDGSADYTPMLSGAWTTLIAIWAVFIIQRIRRRQPR
ncbi:MAG: hypothetical protein ACK4UQ_10735 [Brevundimonas sp.]